MSTNQATAILYTIRSFSAKAKIQVCLTYEFKHTTLKCWMLKLTLLYAGTIILFNLRHSKPIKSSRALFDTLPTYTTSASNLLGSIEQDLLRLNLTGRDGTVAIRRYRDMRKFILQKSRERRVTSKRQAGEDTWNDLRTDAIFHPSLRGFQAKFDSPHMGPFANFHRALDSLILDVLKKAAGSRRAARMNSDDEEERSVAGPSGTQPEAVVRPPPTIYEEKPFKIIYIETTAALQGTARSLPWILPVGGVANRNWLGVLKHYTLQELGEAVCKHLDDGKHPRMLVELIDDDQVNAWVRLSNARPLTVACFLHRAPAPPPDGPPDAPLVRPNTPLARRGDRYLEPGQFDVAEFYTEPASDSELEDDLAHPIKHWKGFPRSDGGWRRRIQTNDRQVLRFQNHSRELISRDRINQGPNYMSSYGDLNGHVLPLPPEIPPLGCDAP
ncbi:hypothetical protein HOY80DRAFT_1006391 [Tuber brumale]|nr:hypothetical protein HOY80DRAFT_1006391 [Tuber brumale]